MKTGVCLSQAFRLMLLIPSVIVLLCVPVICAGDITLAWEPNTQPELAGYRLCYGIASGQYVTVIDVGNVTTHTIPGLTSGTYYFAVKAYSLTGEESNFSNEASTTITGGSDTQPPVIISVASANITVAAATIVWTTNEISNSQVEYGTTSGYGSNTILSGDLVTAHSQILSGLAPGTTYRFRVKSRDIAGNLAVSGDYQFTTVQSNGTPPPVSAISVSNITNKSATISWSTDKLTDSEVEYWTEGSNTRKSTIRTLAASHSLTLNNLQKLTQYHFRIKSTDAAGNQVISPEHTFGTTDYVATILALPHFSSAQNILGEDTAIGFAFTNLGWQPDALTFMAMEDNGIPASGAEIVNPVTEYLGSRSQLSILDWQIFGNGYLNSNSNGWTKLDSNSGTTNGFFLIFDTDLTLLDGANFSDSQFTDFAFTEIQEDGYNKISIINGNEENARADIQLVAADGTIRSTQSRIIPKNGALTADLFDDVFVGTEPDTGSYILVKSDKGLRSFQVMRQKSGDIATLAGQDITAGGTTLYSPQYVHGNSYRTALSIINLDAIPGTVTFRYFREDGVQIGATRILAIQANGKLYIEDPEFFLPLDPSAITAGYIKVVSDGIRIAGSTVFGDRNRQSFISSLALISDLQTSMLFSHIASNDLYFTGLAILNPNLTEATVTIQAFSADGVLLGIKNELIGPQKRKAALLTQYFPSLMGKDQTSGYIRLSSDLPIASYAAFGTCTLSALSAIPPQTIH
jgi:hypothetical protein